MNIFYDPKKTLWHTLRDILEVARTSGIEDPVARHLIGAQLAIQFPILNNFDQSDGKANGPPDQPGNFLINNTAFHITASPTPGHYEKCRANIASGYRAYLLVPERITAGVRQNAEMIAPGRIAVESIETFIAQNIEELAVFAQGEIRSGFRRLLETYNQRVDQVERDKSLLIEIPRNLG